jgi:hypothetical protein
MAAAELGGGVQWAQRGGGQFDLRSFAQRSGRERPVKGRNRLASTHNQAMVECFPRWGVGSFPSH